jgi:hypothetical protein
VPSAAGASLADDATADADDEPAAAPARTRARRDRADLVLTRHLARGAAIGRLRAGRLRGVAPPLDRERPPTVVAGDGLVVVVDADRATGLDAATGRQRWAAPLDDLLPTTAGGTRLSDLVGRERPEVAIDGDLVLVGTARRLAALDVADGTRRWVARSTGWRLDALTPLDTTVVLRGRPTRTDDLDEAGRPRRVQPITVLDRADGTVRWTTNVPSPSTSTPPASPGWSTANSAASTRPRATCAGGGPGTPGPTRSAPARGWSRRAAAATGCWTRRPGRSSPTSTATSRTGSSRWRTSPSACCCSPSAGAAPTSHVGDLVALGADGTTVWRERYGFAAPMRCCATLLPWEGGLAVLGLRGERELRDLATGARREWTRSLPLDGPHRSPPTARSSASRSASTGVPVLTVVGPDGQVTDVAGPELTVVGTDPLVVRGVGELVGVRSTRGE